jgi:RecA-family ATPase
VSIALDEELPPLASAALAASQGSTSTASRFRRLDFRELSTAAAPERHWFLPGWLTPGAGVFAAPGGFGKGLLVQHLLTAGALGRQYFSAAPAPFRGLLWECEDDHDELWRRQERICSHEGVAMSELSGRLQVISGAGQDNVLMHETRDHGLQPTPLFETVRQFVNDREVDVAFFSTATHILEANHDDRIAVTRFLSALAGMVTDRPFAAFVILHISRNQGSEYSGSVAWENAARMRWLLSRRPPDQREAEGEGGADDGVRYLSRRKSNYGPLDHVRMRMQDGLLVPDQPAVSGRVSGLMREHEERRAEEILQAGFRTLADMGIAPSDKQNSPDYLPRQMLDKGLAMGFSRDDLARAMNRLMTAGRFTRGVVGHYSNRTPKHGLVMTAAEVA